MKKLDGTLLRLRLPAWLRSRSEHQPPRSLRHREPTRTALPLSPSDWFGLAPAPEPADDEDDDAEDGSHENALPVVFDVGYLTAVHERGIEVLDHLGGNG